MDYFNSMINFAKLFNLKPCINTLYLYYIVSNAATDGTITATSRRQGVLNRWQLGCLLNSVFKTATKKTPNLFCTGLFVRWWIPITKGQWCWNPSHIMTLLVVDARTWVCMVLTLFSRNTLGSNRMTPRECYVVSKHRPLDCLFNGYTDPTSKKHQSPHYWVFVRGIRRWPVNSPQKGPILWEKFPFDEVIMPPREGWAL